jgi:Phosphotransferase enzyme family
LPGKARLRRRLILEEAGREILPLAAGSSGLPWAERGWLEGAVAWIDEKVARTGELELFRALPWAATARVPTPEGPLWFKESAPSLAFEPALTSLVARRRPDCAPPVVAADGRRMLTRDCGPHLRDVYEAGATEPWWEAILPLYAETQLALAADVGDALAVGAPDKRVSTLPELAAGLGADELTAARVARAAEALDDAIPVTIVHEEIHEGNVFVLEDRVFFLDWAEACVSHPFVGTLLSLRAATERAGLAPGSAGVERLRDLYLEPFTRFAPLAELRERFVDGLVLGAVCRALTWRRILAPLSPQARGELADRVERWLEILAGVASGATRLGEA